METWGVVVAAGRGVRFGTAKQFLRLGTRTVVERSVGPAHSVCDGVIVVVPPDAPEEASPVARSVVGGATRTESVRHGLAAVPNSADVVVVHDAARPLATEALWRSVIQAVADGADGAVPALPVADTIKRVADGVVVETIPRGGLWSVQTPQAFRAEVLRRAHETERDATDDAALVEAVGGRVVVVEGEARNLKITAPDDLALATAFLEER